MRRLATILLALLGLAACERASQEPAGALPEGFSTWPAVLERSNSLSYGKSPAVCLGDRGNKKKALGIITKGATNKTEAALATLVYAEDASLFNLYAPEQNEFNLVLTANHNSYKTQPGDTLRVFWTIIRPAS